MPLPPPPVVGSPRYFALLYTPAPMRATLTTLLALADEISAGAGRGLDHSVAHVRLDWWRLEAERYARGQPQHPWLRALLARQAVGVRLNLQPLVEAAASDLATETLSARPGAALQGAVFRLAETALRAGHDAATASPALQLLLNDLGERACELERFATRRLQPQTSSTATPASGTPATTLKALRQQAEGIDSQLQPQLAPLLVWIALAARQAQRSAGTKSGSGIAVFADNIAAWSAARRALRGRFRID
jgi:hypothetical protein